MGFAEPVVKSLSRGDGIRLKVRTISGWKGTGTVVEDQVDCDDGVIFVKDASVREWPFTHACRHEVARISR